MTEDSRTTGFLLARRALAEKATPEKWNLLQIFAEDENYVGPETWADMGKAVCICRYAKDAQYIAANDPPTVIADIDEILRLRAEVEFWRQETQHVRENFERTLQCERDKTDLLEREADWLAEQLSYSCSFTGEQNCGIPKPCPKTYGCGCLDVEAEEWREAARKTVEEMK